MLAQVARCVCSRVAANLARQLVGADGGLSAACFRQGAERERELSARRATVVTSPASPSFNADETQKDAQCAAVQMFTRGYVTAGRLERVGTPQ